MTYARFIRCTLLACLPFPFHAAIAQVTTIALKGTTSAFTAGTGAVTIPVPIGDTPDTLRVACGVPFDCTKVKIGGDAEEYVSAIGAGTRESRAFAVPGGKGAVSFTGKVVHGTVTATNELRFVTTKAPDGAGGAGDDEPTLAQQVALWLATPCRSSNPERQGADIVMTPFGRVLYAPRTWYDDERTVTVSVLADQRVAHLIDVKMTSDLAKPVVTNIYGADQAPFKREARADSARGGAPAPVCVYTPPEPLGPFADPKGSVQVTVYDGTAVKDLGSTQFVVAPLYTGMFTIGGVSTGLASPTFQKAFNGTDTVIVQRETGRRLMYTAMYTHFWKKRTLKEPLTRTNFWQGITPVVGTSLSDVGDNGFVGASVELRPGLTLMVGRHFGRVTVLDTSTGAAVGAAFESKGDVPTDKKWKNESFVGVGLDVRAAGGLLKSILGAK